MAIYKKHNQKILILLILLVSLLTVDVAISDAQQKKHSEYEVKAAFIYNFLKFIDWPNGAFAGRSDTVKLCVLGDDLFGTALNSIEEETVKDKKITIKHYNKFVDLGKCHILFICSSEKNQLTEILDTIKDMNILTVSDTRGFAQQGVVINFYIEEDKVRFEINQDAANRSGLKISSKLLSLAKIVRGAGR